MGVDSEDMEFVMEHLRRMAEPNTALIITQNEDGEIIDARIMDVAEAMFILRHAQRGERTEPKPETSESSWWSPSS